MKRDLLSPLKRSLLIACLTAGIGTFAQNAPVAGQATNVLNGSCNANWGAVTGATGYRIDVSTQPDFSAAVPSPWINEFRYNVMNQTGVEFVEVVIPNNYSGATDLKISLYNASGDVYATTSASEWTTGINAPAGHTIKYKEIDLQTFTTAYLGGIALSHTVNGTETLIHFISYGSYPINAVSGPAAGHASQQVQSPSYPTHSSRLQGTGGRYLDFAWETGTTSKGNKNNNQTLTPSAQYDAFIAPYADYDCGNVQQLTLNNLNPGTTYYYRVRATDGSVTSTDSNVIMFKTLSPKIWSNNIWVKDGMQTTPPTINDDVIIEDDFVFGASGDGTFAARSLTLVSGSLLITSGNSLQVRRGIINFMSENEFIVENNANILQENSDVANVGDITQKKNSSMLYKLDYTIWSSPVTGQNLQSFSPLTLPHRFYTYDTATDEYLSIPATGDFQPGAGYLIRMPDTWPVVEGYDEGYMPIVFNGEFKGTPNNGTVVVPTLNSGSRLHMIGNPYPSPINVHEFFDANILNIEPGTPIWIWRKRNNPDATSYATVTKAGYTANFALGGDTSAGQFNSNSSEDWILNPGQGFFVRTSANAQGVVFTNGMRRGINNGQFFRMNDNDESTDENAVSRLRLTIDGEGEFESAQAIVAYSAGTTNELDYGWDGQMLSSGNVKIYTKVADTKLVIQARAGFTSQDIVPLMIDVENPGTYTLSIDQNTGVFEADQDVLLKDNLTGVTHNLTENEYSFTSEGGVFESRFELMYESNALGTNNPVADANNVIVFKQGNTININSGALEMSGVTIYDMRGRVMYDNQAINGTEALINDVSASQQVLLVQIATVANGTVTKKIIF
jgi:hypothetical protein